MRAGKTDNNEPCQRPELLYWTPGGMQRRPPMDGPDTAYVKVSMPTRAEAEGVDRLADVGHKIAYKGDQAGEGAAIVRVANMLAELEEWRSGKRRPVGEASTLTRGGYVHGDQVAIGCVNESLDELAEWREGKRTRPDVAMAQREAGLHGALMGLGWTPPPA